MNYLIATNEPLPESIAKALDDYYRRYGPPPDVTESIEVVIVNGEVVDIEFFSVKETE